MHFCHHLTEFSLENSQKDNTNHELPSPSYYFYLQNESFLVNSQKAKAMDDKEKKENRGLYEKFTVYRNDGRDTIGCKHFNCEYFVLDLTHDRHAIAALEAYSNSCAGELAALAEDLRIKVMELKLKNKNFVPAKGDKAMNYHWQSKERAMSWDGRVVEINGYSPDGRFISWWIQSKDGNWISATRKVSDYREEGYWPKPPELKIHQKHYYAHTANRIYAGTKGEEVVNLLWTVINGRPVYAVATDKNGQPLYRVEAIKKAE